LRFFNPGYAWHSLRLLAACALSFGACKLIGLSEVYWALVTAVVVTQPAWDDTLNASRYRILGTLIGALAGLVVIYARQHGGPPLILFWIALTPLAILTAIKPNLRLSCITLIIIVLVPTTGDAYALPFERIIGILLGTVASILVAAATEKRSKPAASE
jgi:uncharacterized membrane protein YccC